MSARLHTGILVAVVLVAMTIAGTHDYEQAKAEEAAACQLHPQLDYCE